MNHPARIPMPPIRQDADRSRFVVALAIPAVLSDPEIIREALRADPANRAAYLAWRDTLAADAEVFAGQYNRTTAAVAEIQRALDAQMAVAS